MKQVLVVAALLLLAACGSASSSSPAVAVQLAAAKAADVAATAADEKAIAELYGWSYVASKDPMVTHGVNRHACITSTNTVDFGFPYSGAQSARFCVKSHVGSDGSQHYDALIIIDRGQLLSGDQGNILVKLDDGTSKQFLADPPDDDSTTALFFSDAPDMVPVVDARGEKTWKGIDPVDRLVDHLTSSKVLKVQVTAYQNGNPVFIFNVAGFSLTKLNAATPADAAVARTGPL